MTNYLKEKDYKYFVVTEVGVEYFHKYLDATLYAKKYNAKVQELFEL